MHSQLLRSRLQQLAASRLVGNARVLDILLAQTAQLLHHSVLQAYATATRRILVRRGSAGGLYWEPTLVDIAGGTIPSLTATLLRVMDRDPGLQASVHTLQASQEPEEAVNILLPSV